MKYCFLHHQTLLLSPVTSTTGYCFCFGSVSSFILGLFLHWSPVAYWAPTDWGVHLLVFYLFAFSYCSWGSQGKNTEVVCRSVLQWTTFCQNSPPWLVHHGWSYMAWLSFIELDKAVVHVIRLVSFLWLWFQSVCPLMSSLSTYHLIGVSLTLDVEYLFMAAPAKHNHCFLPWMWDISSPPLLLTLDMGYLLLATSHSRKMVSVQFSQSVVSDSLRPHESHHSRPPCPSPPPRVHSKSLLSSWWCQPAISFSVVPFSSCPQPLPASESFPMSQLFA